MALFLGAFSLVLFVGWCFFGFCGLFFFVVVVVFWGGGVWVWLAVCGVFLFGLLWGFFVFRVFFSLFPHPQVTRLQAIILRF